MVYGLCMGGLFVASVLWFEAAASMLGYDKVLALLGNAAPVIALMISMCMRLIPQFLRRGRTVLAVQDAIDVPGRAPADPGRLIVCWRRRSASLIFDLEPKDLLPTSEKRHIRQDTDISCVGRPLLRLSIFGKGAMDTKPGNLCHFHAEGWLSG